MSGGEFGRVPTPSPSLSPVPTVVAAFEVSVDDPWGDAGANGVSWVASGTASDEESVTLTLYDADGNGVLDFAEFVEAMTGCAGEARV